MNHSMDIQLSPQLPGAYPTWTNPYVANDSSAARGVVPTLIKSLAVHLTSAASFGHLLSLRNVSNGGSTILLFHIIVVLLFPLLPVAQVLRQLYSTIALSFQKQPLDIRFSIGSFCGMHATNLTSDGFNEPLKRLAKIDRSRLHRMRAPYNYLWLGRVVMLLALLAQYCGTILLWYRRATRARYVRVWDIDTRNLEVALGGFFTVIFSLVISFLNTRWKIVDESQHDSQPLSVINQSSPSSCFRHHGMDSDSDCAACHGEQEARDDMIISATRRPTNSSRRGRFLAQSSSLFGRVKVFCVRFRSLNVEISRATTRVYPLDLQWDIELAYFLKVFISLFIMPFDGNYSFFFDYSADLFLSPYSLFWAFVDCFFHAGYTPWSNPKAMVLMMVFYLLPFITILIHMSLWVVSKSPLGRTFPNIVQKIAVEVDFWFRTGRTLFSIPLSLLMLTPLYFQLLFIVFDFRVIWRCEAARDIGGCLWSDPVAESLFVF